MTCGYWLRLNGIWSPIEGVQAGVGVESERGSSSFTSVGGVRHMQASRRRARTWQVSLGQAGPESVAALMVAAQGDGGDVMLWDESAARANLLDPVATRGREGYPVVDCGGIGLVSLTRGPSGGSGPTVTRDVLVKANVSIRADLATDSGELGATTETHGLVKVSVPTTPSGLDLASAALVLTSEQPPEAGTVIAKAATNAWAEMNGESSYWTSVAGGATVGSAEAAPVTSIPLSGVSAFAGTDMSLRLSRTSGASWFFPRSAPRGYPVLRLTYTRVAEDTIIRQYLRAGSYFLSMQTDAAPGTTIGTIASGASVPIVIPANSGTGLRWVTIDLSAVTSTADREYTITLTDSAAYVLAGLMLSNVAPTSYLPPSKTPARVHAQDPTLTLDSLYAGEYGVGERAVTISEVGT